MSLTEWRNNALQTFFFVQKKPHVYWKKKAGDQKWKDLISVGRNHFIKGYKRKLEWQNDGPWWPFIWPVMPQQYLYCKETVKCQVALDCQTPWTGTGPLPPLTSLCPLVDSDWGSIGVFPNMSGRPKFEILLWLKETFQGCFYFFLI